MACLHFSEPAQRNCAFLNSVERCDKKPTIFLAPLICNALEQICQWYKYILENVDYCRGSGFGMFFILSED